MLVPHPNLVKSKSTQFSVGRKGYHKKADLSPHTNPTTTKKKAVARLTIKRDKFARSRLYLADKIGIQEEEEEERKGGKEVQSL